MCAPLCLRTPHEHGNPREKSITSLRREMQSVTAASPSMTIRRENALLQESQALTPSGTLLLRAVRESMTPAFASTDETLARDAIRRSFVESSPA
jgi:hypothetical protein